MTTYLCIYDRLSASELAWFLTNGYERDLPERMRDRASRMAEARRMIEKQRCEALPGRVRKESEAA